MEQKSEWNAAQSIEISEDLVAAAKVQLRFLAAVDRNRWLYEDHTLQKAIYRYNSCWLPLLAKHSESPVTKGPLVVPLDCEWVWHCHRLNPVRYKSDCEEFYGRILDYCNVASSVEEISRKETEEIWNSLYPDQPYDINLKLSNEFSKNILGAENHTKYDLVLAIKRQIPFFYQVSRPHMNNVRFLEESVARYKGFLHLIKRNKERSVTCFCVPTYDIDLIWHTHQLHPASYCKDLMKTLGKILEHDDTDQNRGKGQKLDVGFSKTIKQWEDLFGLRYWKAGAMYKGSTPSPITTTPFIPELMGKEVNSNNKFQKLINLPQSTVIEVVLEFVEIKNLQETYQKKVSVLFSKAEPDGIFDVKRKLNIQSEFGKKQVATFQCKPTGNLFFELVSESVKPLGYCSISLQDLVSNLSVEKWLDLVPSSGTTSSDPTRLKVAASCTMPVPAPHVLKIPHSPPLSKSLTQVADENGNGIIGLQITNGKLWKELIGTAREGETVVLGQLVGSEWSLMDSLWTLNVQKLILTGPHTVKLVHGRKLDYEQKHHERQTHKHNFITAVEFSAEYPYGRAVALLDVNSGGLMVKEASFVLPGILLGFIVCKIWTKEGYNGLSKDGEGLIKQMEFMGEKVSVVELEKSGKLASGGCGSGCGGGCGNMVNGGGCGSGCGGGCGNMVNGGGCGSGCGGGCGNTVNGGGCGSGCGGGCGNVVNSGGCGSGCGGGCGNMVESGGCGSGCGGGCGGGCGNMVKSGGCGGGGCGGGCGGGGCGGGCGSMMKSGCFDNVSGGQGNDGQPMQVATHA